MNELNDRLLARFLPVDSSDIYQREVRSKKEFQVPYLMLECMNMKATVFGDGEMK